MHSCSDLSCSGLIACTGKLLVGYLADIALEVDEAQSENMREVLIWIHVLEPGDILRNLA